MFEETLKGMIQEARQMVKREETESGDEVMESYGVVSSSIDEGK